MRHIFLVTHGQLAKGYKETVEMIIGARSNFTVLSAYVDEMCLEVLLKPFLEIVNTPDEIIVFTDVAFGSVNAFFMPYLNHPNIHVITGINLPLVLSLTILPEETKLTKAFILQEIEYAKDQIIYMNDHTIQIDDDDEL